MPLTQPRKVGYPSFRNTKQRAVDPPTGHARKMPAPLCTTVRHYQMDRLRISFVKFILEAYDNIAVLSTVTADPVSGKALVRITAAPGCDALVKGILDDLAMGTSVMDEGTQGD